MPFATGPKRQARRSRAGELASNPCGGSFSLGFPQRMSKSTGKSGSVNCPVSIVIPEGYGMFSRHMPEDFKDGVKRPGTRSRKCRSISSGNRPHCLVRGRKRRCVLIITKCVAWTRNDPGHTLNCNTNLGKGATVNWRFRVHALRGDATRRRVRGSLPHSLVLPRDRTD